MSTIKLKKPLHKTLYQVYLYLSRTDGDRYDWLAIREQDIVQVLKNFNSRRRNQKQLADGDDAEDSDS